MNFTAGLEVKIVAGSHKGKVGIVGKHRPKNGHQAGKIPVLTGRGQNEVVWIRPQWLSSKGTSDGEGVRENFPPSEQHQSIPRGNSEVSLSDEHSMIMGCLSDRRILKSDTEIAIAVGLGIFPLKRLLKDLMAWGLIEGDENGYTLSRKGLESWQSKQLDCLKESVDFVEEESLLEDLTGLNPSTMTPMPAQSCDRTSDTESSREISGSTHPLVESIVSLSVSPAPEQPTPEAGLGLTTKNQTSGLKPYDVSASANHDLSLWNSLKELSIEDFEQYLEASEWRDICSIIRKSSTARKTALSKAEKDCLWSPTLTACPGRGSRPAGQTKCEEWLKKQGIIPPGQVLSVQGMALLSGFPPNWTDCLLGTSRKDNPTGSEADICMDAPLSPSKQPSPCSESSTSIPLSIGVQWIDPKLVQLKNGTQPRDCDDLFAGNLSRIQQYAEDMKAGLWNFEKPDLPIAFLDSQGNIHASDCHHRVSAAIAAGVEKILIDLREGELVDAKLFAVTANVGHGLPLRPKDHRKRIEMTLDLLDSIDAEKSEQLLNTIPDLGKFEKANSLEGNRECKWTARTIAKYLRLNESGYRTVQNAILERKQIKSFAGFEIGELIRIKDDGYEWEGKIHGFDKRKGAFVIPLPWTVGDDGKMLPSRYVNTWDLRKLSQEETAKLQQAIERNDKRQPQSAPTAFASVAEEIRHQSQELGVPEELPEIPRNEGDPESLQKPSIVAPMSKPASLIPFALQLSDAELMELWTAIAPRIKAIGGLLSA